MHIKMDYQLPPILRVKTLGSIEHIRQRPVMYLKQLGDGRHPCDGIYCLLKEIIDNSVDEYIVGFGCRIDVSINEKQVTVRDYGHGIPFSNIIKFVSEAHSGKLNTDVFQFSVGLWGAGATVVNALSEYFEVRSFREGRFKKVVFKGGNLVGQESGKSSEQNGTMITFSPDPLIFPNFVFNKEFVKKRLWNYAYLNYGLSLYFNGKRFYSRNGLPDLIEAEAGNEKLYNIIHYRNKNIEFAFCHSSNYQKKYYSFANGHDTSNGGVHLSAFKEGLLRAMNNFTRKRFASSDVCDGIVGGIAIKVQDPFFETSLKNKLSNTDIRKVIVKTVKDFVLNYINRHPDQADIIIEKVVLNQSVKRRK